MPLPSIRWYGPVRHVGGYGNATRAYLRALLRLGHRVQAIDVNLNHETLLEPSSRDLVNAVRLVDAGALPIEIFHGDPHTYHQLGAAVHGGRVGVTVFETMSIPPSWVAPLNGMDAVWVPSEFHKRLFAEAGVHEDKIAIVPFCIDTSFFHDAYRPRAPRSERRFRFLYVSVWDFRKQVDLLARAFVEEFASRGRDDVELFLQTSIPDKYGDDAQRAALAQLQAAVGDLGGEGGPKITLQTRTLTQEELRALYATADLYISTDRNNIWTLPCAETYAMGIPAATSDYARVTSFLSDDNPLLIRCEQTLTDTPPELARLRPIYANQRWATFGVDEVRRVLRFAVSERAALAKLAEKGRDWVHAHQSIDAVAPYLQAALAQLPVRPHLRSDRVTASIVGYNSPSDSLRRTLGNRLRGRA